MNKTVAAFCERIEQLREDAREEVGKKYAELAQHMK